MMIQHNDNPSELNQFKEIFRLSAIEFLEFYTHNWIFGSKRIKDAHGHYKAKFKIIRRIKNPENFTYFR